VCGEQHSQKAGAEAALDWLYERRARMPPEMLDPREAGHRKALGEAVHKLRGL
jgi:hypothetical protein